MDDNQSQDNIYLKKRLQLCKKENEILKKENDVVQKQLVGLKGAISDIVEGKKRPKTAGSGDNEFQLRCVLDFQRNRIEALQQELDSLNLKYQQILFSKKDSNRQNDYIAESTRLLNSFSGSNEEVIQLRKKVEESDMKIQQLTQQYAQQISGLKNQIAQQDAEIILYSGNNDQYGQAPINQISSSSSSSSSSNRMYDAYNINSYNNLRSQLSLSSKPSLEPIKSQQSISAASHNHNYNSSTNPVSSNPYENSYKRDINSSVSSSGQNNDIKYYNYSNNTLFKY